MDITIFICIFQCIHAVESQSTVKDSHVTSNVIENRLIALEEKNRRQGQTLHGILYVTCSLAIYSL